jgi:dihydroneopterin aldolase
MSDYSITIEGLDFYAYHGCVEEEKRLGHRYIIDAEIKLIGQAHITDKIEDSIDYAEVCSSIVTFASESQCWHVEFLAKEICDLLFLHYPRIQEITIHVKKPLPPAPIIVNSVGVRYKAVRS